MQKVLITGATSFLGASLLKRLSERYEVYGTISSTHSLEKIKNEKRKTFLTNYKNLVELDLTDLRRIEVVLDQLHPDFIIHVAGDTTNYSDNKYDLNKSLSMHFNPLETIYRVGAAIGCQGIILTGSSAEYGESDEAHKENEDCTPLTSYGLSKLIQTKAGYMLAKRYGIPTRVVRVFNIFGAFENDNKLIPSIVNSLKNNLPFSLSHGNQLRSFSHISNVVDLYESLLKNMKLATFDIVNSCTTEGVSLKEVLLLLAQELKLNQELLKFGEKDLRPGEGLSCVASTEKAISYLGKKTNIKEELTELANEFR